ncbi:MAG: tetratricopeptide repeat protein [Candidatus Wallbacteria bacterium]|nr:tetratricopeptide repeat protein [Candidatus Wallbacteria bacterium]
MSGRDDHSGDGPVLGDSERYLGWAHLAVAVAALILALWGIPTERELSRLLTQGDLGELTLMEAARELGQLGPEAPALARARALRVAGLALGKAGRPDEMLDHLRQAVAAVPDWPAGRLTLADACRDFGRSSEELGELEAVGALMPRLLSGPRAELREKLADFPFAARRRRPPAFTELEHAAGVALLPWRRRLAVELDYRQRPEAAAEQYAAMLAAEPDDPAGWVRLAQLERKLGRQARAERALAQAFGCAPAAARRFQESQSPQRLRRLLDAVSTDAHRSPRRLAGSAHVEARLGIPLEPAELELLDLLRDELVRREHPDEAVERMRRAVERRPGDREARANLARSLERTGNVEAALVEYRRLRDTSSAGDDFADDVERMLRALGDADGLIVELSRRFERHPSLAVGIELGRNLEWADRHTEAVDLFGKLRKLYPEDLETLAGLASSLRALDRHAEAVGVLTELLTRLRGNQGPPDSRPADAEEPPRGGSSPAPAAAARPEASAQAEAAPVRRRVLALYRGSEENVPEKTRIHELLELAFDHLGMLVDYADVEAGLPDPAVMEPYAGVITWFDGRAAWQPRELLAWLGQQVDEGRKLVILGGTGALFDLADGRPVDREAVGGLMKRLGLEHRGVAPYPVPRIVPLRVDSLARFERAPANELQYTETILSADPANRVLLALQAEPGTDSGSGPSRTDALVLSSRGLYASPGVAYYHDPVTNRRQLRIDAFALLAELFECSARPAPDVTTTCGLRTALVHVDGDGAANATSVRGYANCLEAVTRRIFAPHRLETTVSFIASELDPRRPGTRALREAALALYRLPWIEPASHGWSHPFDWRNPQVSSEVAARHDSPYGLLGFTLEQELRGSVEVMARLTGRKPGEIPFHWSGACNPSEDQIAFARTAGIACLNGGDGRCDEYYDSLTNLAPMTRPVGRERQVLTPQANEFALSAEGAEPLGTFRKLRASWDRSERPRRLKPAGLYFHHYLAQSPDGLAALEELHRTLREGPYTPVPVSEYLRQVEGFRALELRRLERPGARGARPGAAVERSRFRVEGAGRCLTLRAPRALGLPDLAASRGVAGFASEGDWTWVTLAPGDLQEVEFAQSPSASPIRLETANLRLERWELSGHRLSAGFRGFGKARITLAGSACVPGVSVRARGAGDPSGPSAPPDAGPGGPGPDQPEAGSAVEVRSTFLEGAMRLECEANGELALTVDWGGPTGQAGHSESGLRQAQPERIPEARPGMSSLIRWSFSWS